MEPAAAPSSHTLAQTVPLTVAPGGGVVRETRRVPAEFATVTERVAVAEPPAASVIVRPSAWLPLLAVAVFQAYDAEVALPVVVNTCVPSMVRR